MSACAMSNEQQEPALDQVDACANLDFPCSAAQERFWVIEQMAPGNASLNIAVRWQLDGPVSVDRLEQAFRAIIARHEILRTTFHEVDGAPVQRVLTDAWPHVAVVDLTDVAAAQLDAEAAAVARHEAQTPFDLTAAPLLRATLLRLTANRSVLLVTMHHLACDGWSIGIIARELGLGYAALLDGMPLILPPLPVQYADYTLWQAEWIKAGGLQATAEYWKSHLAGMQRFEVRPDHPRPAMQTSNGHILSVLLPRALTEALQALARRQGATMFSAALAALSGLLHRYTAEAEITVGTQVAGREDADLEHLVGLFINTLVLRTDLSGNPTYTEHVGRVRDTVQDALANQHMPIEHIIAMLRPMRSLSRDPLISVNFIFQRSFITNATYGDITLTDLPSVTSGALYDLNFFMVERPDGWRLSCEYNTDLFAEPTVAGLLEAFGRLLAEVVVDPDRPISDYVLTDAAERARLIEAAGGTGLPAVLADRLPAPVCPNARLYVVEGGRQLAMPNAAGELWIAGVTPRHDSASMAEAARFVPDSFGPDPRRRLYRSGALVRRRHDGSLETLSAPPADHFRAAPPALPVESNPDPGGGPPTQIERQLAGIWAAVLEVPTVGVTENFFDLGGHSLLAARMLARVEAVFGQRLPLVSLFRATTVREFAVLLGGAAQAPRDFEVVPVNPHGDRTPIFAINNTGLFYRLSRHLGVDQPFIAVSAYDPAAPEAVQPQTFEDITSRYVEIIRRVQPHGPYVLLGLCVAGNIAFEAAQQLVRLGEQVPLVVLIDAWSPAYFTGMTRREARVAEFSFRVQSFAGELGKLVRGRLSPLDFLGQRGIFKRLRKRLLRAAQRTGRLRSVELDPYNTWFQGHLEAASCAYQPQPFNGRVLVFHNPAQPSGRFLDPTFGWGKLAQRGIAVHAIPGDHLSIFDEAGAGIMAAHLDQALDGTNFQCGRLGRGFA